MNKRFISISLAAVLGAGYSLAAFAQARPEVLVRQRQAAMTLQFKYFVPLNLMATGKAPYDAKIAARNAGYLDALARMPWDGFVASTKDLKSRATPAVFTDTAKFKEAADKFEAEVTKLVAAARGSDEAAAKAQITAVNNACNSCHESFRERQ